MQMYSQFRILILIAIGMTGAGSWKTAHAQMFRLVKSDPTVQWTQKMDATSQVRSIDPYSAEYSCMHQGEQYRFLFQWGPLSADVLRDGDVLEIPLTPSVIQSGRYVIGTAMGTEALGILRPERILNPGRAETGLNTATGQLFRTEDKARYQIFGWDEEMLMFTVWGAVGQDRFVLARYFFRRVGTATPVTPAVQLGTPQVDPGLVWGNMPWVAVKLPGQILESQKRTLLLVARFFTQDGRPLPAVDANYRDAAGFVVAAQRLEAIPSERFPLDDMIIYLPHAALGLPDSGGRVQHTLKCYVEAYVDGQSTGVSNWAFFTVVR